MTKKALALILFSVFIIGGCTAKTTPAVNLPTATPNAQIVGGDKDIHGCIGSAGYTWCDVKQKCLRTWEETCK